VLGLTGKAYRSSCPQSSGLLVKHELPRWPFGFTIDDTPNAAQFNDRKVLFKCHGERPEALWALAMKAHRWLGKRMTTSAFTGFVRLNPRLPQGLYVRPDALL